MGTRIVQGVALAFGTTYAPVWINNFAPRKTVTQWISYMQSLSMIGIIVGYIVGSIAADAKELGISEYFNWRRALFTQGIALYINAFFFLFYPNEKIDILADLKMREETNPGSARSKRSQNQLSTNLNSSNSLTDILDLIANPVYMSTMLVMSSMYFSSTGLQFWTIQYMATILGAS